MLWKERLLFVLKDTLKATIRPIVQRHVPSSCIVYSQKVLPLPNYQKLEGESFFPQYWTELKKKADILQE